MGTAASLTQALASNNTGSTREYQQQFSSQSGNRFQHISDAAYHSAEKSGSH